jgi:GNAT superfamily N-acetyltransferase
MGIIQASTPAQMDQFRELIAEYINGLLDHEQVDSEVVRQGLKRQAAQQELERLPGEFGPPAGRILLAYVDGDLAGCVALKQINACVCEMKRLYLRPAFRGQGIGRALVQSIIDEARELCYVKMSLHTGKFMQAAPALYCSLGFAEVKAPDDAPQTVLDNVDFMELDLANGPTLN